MGYLPDFDLAGGSMNADMQLYLSITCVGLAVAYCLLRWWRGIRQMRAGGCGNSCGCQPKTQPATDNTLIDVQSITSKIRKQRQSATFQS